MSDTNIFFLNHTCTYSMSVKKAIKMLDWWIKLKRHNLEEFKKKGEAIKSLDVYDLYPVVYKLDETTLYNLAKIKVELTPKCRHAKKYHDMSGGIKYCMNCNLEL